MNINKDPDAVLDYSFDWSAWLDAVSDTIDTFTLIAETGLSIGTSSESNGVVTFWLSGGTVGEVQSVTCRIETVGGRTEDRTMNFIIDDR